MNTNSTDILRVKYFTRKTSKRAQSQCKCRASWFQVESHGRALGHGRTPISPCFASSCSADNSVCCNYLSTTELFWPDVSFGKVLLQMYKIWTLGYLFRPEIIGRDPMQNTKTRTVAAKARPMISLSTSQLPYLNEKSGPTFLCCG
jgi:hypothetical protein